MQDPPKPLGFVNRVVHWVARMGVCAYLKVYHRIAVKNGPRIDGAFVVVANHASFLDPLVLGAVVPARRAKRVRFLMNGTTARNRSTNWFYRWNRMIPVYAHGGNRQAIRDARRVLSEGEIVGVFPEGGLSRDGDLMLGNPGALSLVYSEDVPIVPAALVNVDKALPLGKGLPRPVRIEVRFGDPLMPADVFGTGHRKEILARGTRRIMQEIAKLMERPAWEDELERRKTASN